MVLSTMGTVVFAEETSNHTRAYTSANSYWGECSGSADTSFELKFFHDDVYMGYTSLNNIDGIIDGDVNVSWHIKLDAESNTDEYWTMEWEVAPTLAMQPNRAEHWVDGVKAAEAIIEPNWSDSIFPIIAAVADENGRLVSYVNNVDAATIENAVANDGTVVLYKDINVDAGLVIPEGANVVIDLNGNSIIGKIAAIVNNGTLTINDSVGTGKVYTTDVAAQGRAAVVNNGTIEINGGWFGDSNNDTSDRNAINRGNAIKNYGTAVINGGYFTNVSNQFIGTDAYAYAINTLTGGTTTINDATVYGDINGLIFSDGKTVVNGGSYTLGRPNEENNLWYLAYGDVEIKGGTWTRAFAVPSWNTGNPTMYGDVVVSGGDFSVEIPSDYLAEGFEMIENADGTFGAKVAIAKIVGGKSFSSLDDALTAAQDGDVIDLLGQTHEITSIAITKKMHTKNLTFQNGTMDFTYAVAGNSLFDMRANQTIKFKDMTLLIKDTAEGSKMCYWMDLCSPTAVAYFENCVIDFDAVQYSYISANGDGKVFFKDCTIEAEQANFVYRAGATFENCTFDGYAGLSEGESAANIILWAAVPCTIKNSTVYTRNIGSITANGTIDIVDNSYVYAQRVRHYYAADNANYNAGLVTLDASSTLEAVELDMGLINEASAGVIKTEASKVYVQYKQVDLDENGNDNLEGSDKYEIVLAGANNTSAKELINELASADLTFNFVGTPVTNGDMDYFVEPAEGVALSQIGDRFMFNYDGVTKYEESGAAIVIGTITIEGYGSYTLGTKDVETNAVYATEIKDNIVDGYEDAATLVVNTDLLADDGMVGEITDGNIAVPTRTLTINLDFPNAVEDNAIAYQDMKVEITGNIDGVNKTVVYELGNDGDYAMINGDYVVAEDALVLNNAYTVTVSGAGYRTARYTVTMTEDKALKFWNNVMDEAQVVEIGKDSSAVNVTFLAGDIVKDNKINIYDLSAVVSYFGQTNDTSAYSSYAKYDLNRDGVIDSKDVAYVLVSWDN